MRVQGADFLLLPRIPSRRAGSWVEKMVAVSTHSETGFCHRPLIGIEGCRQQIPTLNTRG